MKYKQDNFFDKDIFLRLHARRDDLNSGNYLTATLMTPISLLYEAVRFPAKKIYDFIYPPSKKTPEQIYKDLEHELYTALANNDTDTVEKILKKEPSLIGPGSCERTPLMFTAEKGLREMTALLLKADEREEKDTQDMFGNTALHLAAQYGNKDIVDLLLENGANPNIENDHGETVQVLTHRSKPNNIEECFTLQTKVELTFSGNLCQSETQTEPTCQKPKEEGSAAKKPGLHSTEDTAVRSQ